MTDKTNSILGLLAILVIDGVLILSAVGATIALAGLTEIAFKNRGLSGSMALWAFSVGMAGRAYMRMVIFDFLFPGGKIPGIKTEEKE